jgi:hypothetical protein
MNIIKRHTGQKELQRIAQALYNRRYNLNEEFVFIGDVIVRSNGSLNFLYFETYTKVDDYKRYHKVVTDDYFIEIYWYESNVIDAGRGYTLQDVIDNFKRDLTYLLKEADKPLISVVEDTIQ